MNYSYSQNTEKLKCSTYYYGSTDWQYVFYYMENWTILFIESWNKVNFVLNTVQNSPVVEISQPKNLDREIDVP